MRNSRLLPLYLLPLLAGCLNFGPTPPPTLMTLTPEASVLANVDRSAPAGQAVTVFTPSVPQALQTLRVPVASSATAVAYLKDAQWAEQPQRLFQRLLAETIAARTGRLVLGPRQSTLDPGTRLAGELLAFGLDAARGEAVVTYDATLIRDGGTVTMRRFEARVPSAVTAQAAPPALNAAANRVAAEVADWVGRP